jgi:hypothetical protein
MERGPMGMMCRVQEEQTARPDTPARMRFDADPSSVPGARRFVADNLREWGRVRLVDDAMLCASELAGNAALHDDCSFIDVSVELQGTGVRLSVDDDGAAPAALVAPRTTLPGLDESFDDELDGLDALLADQPATGRGPAIVSALAAEWGVETLPRGKRVWADLAEDPAADGRSVEEERRSAVATADLPAGWLSISLPGCPTDLARRHDQHLDDLVRELKLMLYAVDSPDSARLARRLQPVVDASGFVQVSLRRQVDDAAAAGHPEVDVVLALPAGFTTELRRFDDAMTEADELSEQRRLLGLPAAPDVRAFRAWLSAQVVGQVERRAVPVSWAAWQAHRREAR